MAESALRWIFSLLAIFLVGPLLALLVHGLRAIDGTDHMSLLVSRSPALGMAIGIGILVAAGAFGIIAARFVTRGTGMAIVGLVAVWSAWQLGTVDSLVRSNAGNPLIKLAIEGLALGLVSVIIAGFIEVTAKGSKMNPKHVFFAPLADSSVFASIAAGVLVGGIVAWFVGYQALKGQALFAAFIGSIGAGAAAQLAPMLLGKDPRPIAGFLAVALLAALGPIVAMLLHGSALQQAVRAGPNGFFGAAVPISLDWVVGMFLGVPVGQSWAASMLEKRGYPATA